jgi:hypothetical protein
MCCLKFRAIRDRLPHAAISRICSREIVGRQLHCRLAGAEFNVRGPRAVKQNRVRQCFPTVCAPCAQRANDMADYATGDILRDPPCADDCICFQTSAAVPTVSSLSFHLCLTTCLGFTQAGTATLNNVLNGILCRRRSGGNSPGVALYGSLIKNVATGNSITRRMS